MAKRRILVAELGTVEYESTNDLQKEIAAWRSQDLIDDVLLLLEHHPVITLGRRADESNVLASPDVLEREGVTVCHAERGGDVTYHGPGQLVGYPILRLADYGLGASDYMHRLEDTVAATLSDYGLRTHRREGVIGVWIGENKIAALGVRVRRGVTFHGLALNVAPNMHHWTLIVPCGIRDGGVTSMALELPQPPDMREVRTRLAQRFAEVFGAELVPTTIEQIRSRCRRLEAGADQRLG